MMERREIFIEPTSGSLHGPFPLPPSLPPSLYSPERSLTDYFTKWASVRTNDRQIDRKNDWVACRTEWSDLGRNNGRE